MAPTAHGIVNVALVRVGHSAIVTSNFLTTPVNETERKSGAIYEYERDNLIRAHDWKFATKRVALSDTGRQAMIVEYDYGYALPSDYLRMVRVIEPTGTDWENGLIVPSGTGALYFLSNETAGADIKIAYMAQVTEPARFDASFVEAFTWKLAGIFAIAFAEDVTKASWAGGNFQQAMVTAERLNAFEEAQHLREERSYNETTGYVKWIDAGE